MKVVFIIPTLNEDKGIAKVIDHCRSLNIRNSSILVVDGNSSDRTVNIARQKNARVLIQKGRGKGAGLRQAVNSLKDQDIVVMVDADGTYSLDNVSKMISFVEENNLVLGNRIFDKNSITLLNRFGNCIFNLLATILYKKQIHDLLTGLRVFKAKTFKSLKLESNGFDIEAEMTLKALKQGVKIIEVPCKYKKRLGETKLNPLKDGFLILKRLLSIL